jgi:hypothetical protein
MISDSFWLSSDAPVHIGGTIDHNGTNSQGPLKSMKARIGLFLALLALGGCATPVEDMRDQVPPAGTASLPGGAGAAAQCIARQLDAWPGTAALPRAANVVQLTQSGAYVYGTVGDAGVWLIDAVNQDGKTAITYRVSETADARDSAVLLIQGGIANCRLGG